MRTRLVAVLATVVLAGCTGDAEPTVAPPSLGVVPESARPAARTPSATPTPIPLETIQATGPLTCRRATPSERWIVGEGATDPEVAWTVELGDGWRIVAGMVSMPGGPDAPEAMVTNGERHNYVYERDDEPFRVRVLPVVLPEGFDAIDLAKDCARRGRA